jgi:DNA-binding PadR family transcriptional regulator
MLRIADQRSGEGMILVRENGLRLVCRLTFPDEGTEFLRDAVLAQSSSLEYDRWPIYRLSTTPMPKQKLSPLPSAAFQILLALVGEDLHGYGIMRSVVEQTEGRMRLGPGTLYSSIRALLEGELIEEVERPPDSRANDERRRYYRLTSAGRKLARSEAERLADLLRVARAKKILRGDYV